MLRSEQVCAQLNKEAERQALSYKQHNEVQQSLGLKMIEKLDLKRSAITVLDLGCGTGNLTKVLAERIGTQGKVIAVDPDRERLKIARENYSSSNIEYIEADDKTFPKGQYDLVFANTVLHWIHDKKSLFEKVYKNLKPGGQFAFVTFDGVPKVHNKVVKRVFEELISPDFLDKFYSTKCDFLQGTEYEALALSLGYVRVCFDIDEYWGRCKNLDDCIDKWYSGLQGAFDPEKFDIEKFQRIKEEYGDGEVVYEKPNGILLMVFAKPG